MGRPHRGGGGGSPPVRRAQWSAETVAILAGAPFALIMIGMVYPLFKALREEKLPSAEVQPGVGPEPGRAMSSPSRPPAPQRMSAEDPREQGSGPYTG